MKSFLAIILPAALCLLIPSAMARPNTVTENASPVFSPDGTRIAFASNRSNYFDIWIRDTAGRAARQITRLKHDMEPAWSPDGKMLAFASYGNTPNGPFTIWVVNVDGSNPRQLTHAVPRSDDNDQYPCWSPDGKYIAFTHGSRPWIMDGNGENAHPLTKDQTSYQYCGQWSPGGDQIAYLNKDGDSQYKIWLINRDGTGQKILSESLAAHQAKWSRDGRFLYTNSEGTLIKIDVESGQAALKLIKFPDESDFDISRDEKWIVYDDDGPDGSGKIYVKPLSKAARL